MASESCWQKIHKFFRLVPSGFNVKFNHEHKSFYRTTGLSRYFHSFNTLVNLLEVCVCFTFCVLYFNEADVKEELKIIRVICSSVTVTFTTVSTVFYWKMCKPNATFISAANLIISFQNTIRSKFKIGFLQRLLQTEQFQNEFVLIYFNFIL